MCAHTTIYVSYTCVLRLLYMCPHTPIYVSLYYCMCILMQTFEAERTPESLARKPQEEAGLVAADRRGGGGGGAGGGGGGGGGGAGSVAGLTYADVC